MKSVHQCFTRMRQNTELGLLAQFFGMHFHSALHDLLCRDWKPVALLLSQWISLALGLVKLPLVCLLSVPMNRS